MFLVAGEEKTGRDLIVYLNPRKKRKFDLSPNRSVDLGIKVRIADSKESNRFMCHMYRTYVDSVTQTDLFASYMKANCPTIYAMGQFYTMVQTPSIHEQELKYLYNTPLSEYALMRGMSLLTRNLSLAVSRAKIIDVLTYLAEEDYYSMYHLLVSMCRAFDGLLEKTLTTKPYVFNKSMHNKMDAYFCALKTAEAKLAPADPKSLKNLVLEYMADSQ